jgi:HSP20 family protein
MMAKKEKKAEDKDLLVPERAEVVSPFEDMERWFGEFLNRPVFPPMWPFRWRGEVAGGLSPSVDIYEDPDAVVVKAELPGMGKADIEVNISNNVVTITGEKKAEEKVEKSDYYRLERSYGRFSRSLRLPGEVLSEQAKASFKDGVLEIRVPKTEESKQKKRKIDIE